MQEKKYPLQEWLFAVVMWAVFSFVLLWLHYKVYGKMLLAGDRIAFWGIVILTPAYPLGRWLSQSSLSPSRQTETALPCGCTRCSGVWYRYAVFTRF